MSKSKTTYEQKLEAVKRYGQGKMSLSMIASNLNVDPKAICQWISNYESMGEAGLRKQSLNSKYSKETKQAAVEAYLSGQGSQMEICKKYQLRSTCQLRDWIKVYNGHRQLRSTGGRGSEIYMTRARATTLQERIEIVSFCIARDKDYAATIETYVVSYQQIYSWVRKYEQCGIAGLEDKRGKRKAESEMTDFERLKAENRLLQAQNRRLELENKLLKKVEELEGRGY